MPAVTKEQLLEESKQQIAHFISEKLWAASFEFNSKASKMEAKKNDILKSLEAILSKQKDNLREQREKDEFSGKCYYFEGVIEGIDHCIKEINQIGI